MGARARTDKREGFVVTRAHLLLKLPTEVSDREPPNGWTATEEAMSFRSLNETERTELMAALRANSEAGRAICTERKDTSFAGTVDDVTDDEVITAIKSVPCHY
jgi:hypothetical protein